MKSVEVIDDKISCVRNQACVIFYTVVTFIDERNQSFASVMSLKKNSLQLLITRHNY